MGTCSSLQVLTDLNHVLKEDVGLEKDEMDFHFVGQPLLTTRTLGETCENESFQRMTMKEMGWTRNPCCLL
jgi:hypothetical protein